MPHRRRPLLHLFAATTLANAIGSATPALAEIKGLELLVPSSPGSGYDQLARAMQAVLQGEKLATGIQVVNVSGGGSVGLAQYVTARKRHPSLLVFGFALVGVILTTKAPVTLQQTTPLARLIGEQNVIAVLQGSDVKSMAELIAKLKADPGSVSWAGGSSGGIDHVLVGLIAKASGVDPTKVNYVVHAGGGEVLASALGGHVTVAVSGYNEFAEQIRAGALRALAVSGDKRQPGLDTPTLKEAGVDVALLNWRGLATPADIRPADKQALGEVIAAMVRSPAWQEALAKRGWRDLYLPADAFAPFLTEQQAQIEGVLKNIGLVK